MAPSAPTRFLTQAGSSLDAKPTAHHNGNDGAGRGAERRPALLFFAAGGKARLFEIVDCAAFQH